MSRSTDLCDGVGIGRAPRMGVDHQEVHGVGTDVENPEAHTASVAVVVHANACILPTGTSVPLRSALASRGARVTRIPAAERRSALIEAALRVVARNGLAQATTRAIVAEAGMSLASFHYVFDSRDELIDELITTVDRSRAAGGACPT